MIALGRNYQHNRDPLLKSPIKDGTNGLKTVSKHGLTKEITREASNGFGNTSRIVHGIDFGLC